MSNKFLKADDIAWCNTKYLKFIFTFSQKTYSMDKCYYHGTYCCIASFMVISFSAVIFTIHLWTLHDNEIIRFNSLHSFFKSGYRSRQWLQLLQKSALQERFIMSCRFWFGVNVIKLFFIVVINLLKFFIIW